LEAPTTKFLTFVLFKKASISSSDSSSCAAPCFKQTRFRYAAARYSSYPCEKRQDIVSVHRINASIFGGFIFKSGSMTRRELAHFFNSNLFTLERKMRKLVCSLMSIERFTADDSVLQNLDKRYVIGFRPLAQNITLFNVLNGKFSLVVY